MENKFESICNELVTLQKAKNADYGDSFSKSVEEFGLTAALIPITNKVNRLKQLVQSDSAQVKDESIDDTLKDLACYAIMTLAERKKLVTRIDAKLEIGKAIIKAFSYKVDKEECIRQFRKKHKEAANIEVDNLSIRPKISKDGWQDLEGCASKEDNVIGDILSNIRHNLFRAELSKEIDSLLKKYNIKL